jgi:TolB protein
MAAALLAGCGSAQAALEITVSGAEVAPRPIAVVQFAQPEGTDTDLAAVIAADLGNTGQFKPLPRDQMHEQPTEASQVTYRNWRVAAVDNVLIGRLTRRGGKTVVSFELFDVLRQTKLVGYDITVPDPRRLRYTAHQIADIVYEKLTGVPGYFNSQIAYVARTGTGKARRWQVVVADADGLNPIAVVTSSEPLMSPSWSPDRQQLAYVSFEHGGRSSIYIHTLATQQRRRLLQERGINGAPAWSPDGRELAVALSFERSPDLYVVDVASGQRRQVTNHFALDTEPAWSPDGRQIAFTSDRGGQPQVYVVSSAGGEARRVTFEGRQNLCPRFSPDGKSLVLINVEGNSQRVAVLDLESRALRLLGEGPLDESPSFAPNGAVVVYAAQGKRGAELATVTLDGRYRQRLSQAGDVSNPAWSALVR